MLDLKLTRLLLVSALALGASAAACGDDEEEEPTPGPDASADTGTAPISDAGSSDASQCTTISGISGMLCTLPTGGSGYRACTGGVPTGACMALGGGIFEGGLPFDAASLFPEGGFSIPDGALNNLGPCPSPLECSSLLGSLASVAMLPAGTSVCAQGLFPPACTTSAECTAAGLTSAACAMGFCVQACKTP